MIWNCAGIVGIAPGPLTPLTCRYSVWKMEHCRVGFSLTIKRRGEGRQLSRSRETNNVNRG